LSQRRAARLIPVRLETLRYQSTRDRQDALRQRLRELAAVRVRFGYRRLTVLLKREGWPVNAKRIYRLYDDEGLTVRTKPRKRLASRPRVPMPAATRPNERWSMDFVSARTADGRWFRTLTVLDLYTRESLALVADRSLTGVKVAVALTRVLRNLLFGITPTDLPTFVIVSLVLAAVALLAAAIPARRATRVDPMVALRSE
jgi:putative transposase